ncbi:hypothetical protein GGR56DRAFT_391651 [Xylariaceae sp. FL0804]|nr:hypothetical protein GGR56DRAFT_391651 [Xylariaceae sp. FL0804]
MNRFRAKRRGGNDTAAPRTPQDSELNNKSFFKKGKKPIEAEKIDIDLSSALPSSDDFRTSLLMNGLSARFSMLREQDDPNTKIGKASDDSVLLPNRQSRMDYSAFRGLGDIAEVESIKAAAPFSRQDSFNTFDDTDSVKASSIMSRSKPTEGNVLFGGRQKIYKIPMGGTSSAKLDGGMTGRALYDDDVAMSAFQKWRRVQRETEGPSAGHEVDESEGRLDGDAEHSIPRSDSPPLGEYNQKRGTSSTMSSIPSMPRNSTAATSIASSHRAPSMKDWVPPSGSGPGLERNVTRTRRLYENGLNHDLHEHQFSALSRIDTLSRQRTFGTRTPDLAQNSPSPTAMGFAERFGSDRRVLVKASAPNLRSMSPPTTASSNGTPDLGIRVPSTGDSKMQFGGVPPLSPPISETDENAGLPIGPNDRGKATALGVFQKPAQPYDESRYAQRQLQLQQGRETPTMTTRKDSNASLPADRENSSSSASAQAFEFSGQRSQAKEEMSSTSFLADADDSEASPATSPKHAPSPLVFARRPSDRQHPAFRNSALPTPLSLGAKTPSEASPVTEVPEPMATTSKDASPSDSPTLGPTTGSGLSGMVRQHMRGDSNASSIYGVAPATAGLESRFPAGPDDIGGLHDFAVDSNPWDVQDANRDWNLDLDVTEPVGDVEPVSHGPSSTKAPFQPHQRDVSDEFASQLADGARRVRQRLTTYAENDSSADPKDSMDLPPPRANGLGILRLKNSRGSLVDRGRDASHSKAMKMLGITPAGSQASSPAREPKLNEAGEDSKAAAPLESAPRPSVSSDEPQQAGVRAFRQARRDLQRLREMETQSRHQQPISEDATEGPVRRLPPGNERPAERNNRSPPRDRKPPPVYYQQRQPSEDSVSHPGSRATSRSARDRSGSDSSHGTRSRSRPAPRSREVSVTRDALPVGPGPRHQLRSPGLPGTDIRRSPIMPPQPPHLTGSAKMSQGGFAPSGSLHAQRSNAYDSGQPSPMSPMPSPFINSAPATPAPTAPPPRRPSVPSNSHSYSNATPSAPGLNDAMKRKVKTRDISEPTFVTSTSRVPTVELPAEAARNRSRSNSRTAPPVPPINPRRRQDSGSRTRTVFESMHRHRGETLAASASTPDLPSGLQAGVDGDRAAFPNGADEARSERRRLRKMTPEFPPMGMNMAARGHSPPVNVGPPASRMVATQGRNRPGDRGLPGGMI